MPGAGKGFLVLLGITMALPFLVGTAFVLLYVTGAAGVMAQGPDWARPTIEGWLRNIPVDSDYYGEANVSAAATNVPWIDYSGPDADIHGVPLWGPVAIWNVWYDKPVLGCGFGLVPGYSMLGAGVPHNGVDFPVDVGTFVHTSMGGEVVWAGVNGGWGNLVVIQNGEYQVWYAHLSEIYVSVGQVVEWGWAVGATGGYHGAPGAGNSSGPHLHYGVKYYNAGTGGYEWLDPARFIGPDEYLVGICGG
jgi:murein DD-endopeptidase MepM/ murein hydrolase activator NlpD